MGKKSVGTVRNKLGAVQIGEVGVDSGMIMIADPCRQISYEQVLGEKRGLTSQINNDGSASTYPLAVVSSSGFGDGIYPVYAMIVDYGPLDKRVAAVTIDFNCESNGQEMAARMYLATGNKALLKLMKSHRRGTEFPAPGVLD